MTGLVILDDAGSWRSVVADETFPMRLWATADLFTPMALRVAATLRLADHVAAGATTVPVLVERTDADRDALGRLVAHLVTVGVLDRGSDGALSLTDLGDQLRDEHPGGGRAWLDIDGAVGRGDLSALHLLDAVRTGQPAYPLTYGAPSGRTSPPIAPWRSPTTR